MLSLRTISSAALVLASFLAFPIPGLRVTVRHLVILCKSLIISVLDPDPYSGALWIHIQELYGSVFRSFMDPDPYSGALWIRIRIQELYGSRSVFGIRIRIHTCKYRKNTGRMCKIYFINSPFRDSTDKMFFWCHYVLIVLKKIPVFF